MHSLTPAWVCYFIFLIFKKLWYLPLYSPCELINWLAGLGGGHEISSADYIFDGIDTRIRTFNAGQSCAIGAGNAPASRARWEIRATARMIQNEKYLWNKFAGKFVTEFSIHRLFPCMLEISSWFCFCLIDSHAVHLFATLEVANCLIYTG